MDRTMRYSRRGAAPASAPQQSIPRPMPHENPNCLCDGQPIALAMAYVKPQPFGEVYSACEGWKNGTLFPDLNKPYGMGGKRR